MLFVPEPTPTFHSILTVPLVGLMEWRKLLLKGLVFLQKDLPDLI
jgi:hypothetical protein